MTCVLRATCRDRRSGWRAAVRLLKRQKKKICTGAGTGENRIPGVGADSLRRGTSGSEFHS